AASTLAAWRAALEHPGEIVCTGPKYQFPYAPDHVHLVTPGYEQLGEKYAQLYFETVVQGRPFQPLQPLATERSENVVRVRFHVPVPPLRWNDALPSPHQKGFPEWAAGRGFELRTATERVAIERVAIDGDSVSIAAAGALPASGLFVGYALTSDGT